MASTVGRTRAGWSRTVDAAPRARRRLPPSVRRRTSRSGGWSRSTATAATTTARSRRTTPRRSTAARRPGRATGRSTPTGRRSTSTRSRTRTSAEATTLAPRRARPYLDRSRHQRWNGLRGRRPRRGVPRRRDGAGADSWSGSVQDYQHFSDDGPLDVARSGVLTGALAASVTPLRDGGAALDEDAFGPVVDFLAGRRARRAARAGDERRGDPALGRRAPASHRALRRRRPRDRLQVAVHCGAQTTADTVALAEHAAAAGADAVAVIAPPYFTLDDAALLEHFAAAARACAPLPFYVYEFAITSGYAVPPDLVRRLREQASEPGRAEGLGPPVGGTRGLPDRGPRRLRRPESADRARAGPGAPSARSPRWPRRSPRSSPPPSAARTSIPVRYGPGSTVIRATRRSSTCSSGAASRSARTCARRCGD